LSIKKYVLRWYQTGDRHMVAGIKLDNEVLCIALGPYQLAATVVLAL
jgi:hypothetical protein